MTTPKEKEHHFGLVHDQGLKVERAETRLQREREKLDAAIAAAVTTDPTSETWYLSPGPLTPEEAAGAAAITELGVHRALQRVRPRVRAEAKRDRERAKRRRSRRSGPKGGTPPIDAPPGY